MNYLKNLTQLVAVVFVLFLFSCSGNGDKKKQADPVISVENKPEQIEINAEAKILLSYLEETGDYVNGRNFPSLIKATSVYEELDKNNHIIDLREPDEFVKGHIKGANNVEFSQLPAYFTDEIKPFEFDRIIVVCYSGQMSSYSASLLRLMGYGNVYAMRWGMSAWNKKVAESNWLAVVSSKFENQLEKEVHEKNLSVDFPKMNTTKTDGEAILTTRFNSLFEAGFTNAVISADKVFEQPANYYTINYDRRDKYEAGHIPGAVRYKPNGTLGIVDEMQTIPNNKEVVVYCGTGHNSSFVTAYLRLFGYDAKTLIFGNNAFMHSKMMEDKSTLSWLPFSEDEIGNYPLVKN